MILVVGATGSLGGQIVHGLLDRRREVRMLVRTGSDYEALAAAGARPIVGDLRDVASLQRACAGVDTIVTTAISLGRRPDDTIEDVDLAGYKHLFRAAERARVRHVVFTSALGADVASPVPFIAAKAANERLLRESAMTWTILSPNAFMDVWLFDVVARPALAGAEVVYVGSGDRHHSFVHSRDVAAFAVAAVDDPRAVNRTLEIAGPTAVSFRDVVAVFERLLGRPIPQRGVAPGQPVPGLPQYEVEMLAGLAFTDSVLDAHAVAEEFGVPQTSVAEWAESLVPAMVR